MRALGAVLAFAIVAGGCDHQANTLKALDVGACIVADETLSVVFTNPKKARDYLVDLATRLGKDPTVQTVEIDGMRVDLPIAMSDPEAVVEAALLVSKLSECVPR